MINALTFDLEYWYSAELTTRSHSRSGSDQLIEGTMPILNLLDIYNVKATFFVLGEVAQKYPSLIKRIYKNGHEIASHGFSHTRIVMLGPKKFEEEISLSIKILSELTGDSILGFRAPTFSINKSTIWALEILSKHNLKYDSSVFPTKNMLYGVPDAPIAPYKISLVDPTKEDCFSDLIEFPLTVLKLCKNIPISGGFYFRVLPLWLLKSAFKKVNQSRPAIIYIHPWETYEKTPRLNDLSYSSKFITYRGISSSLRKLEELLKVFRFAPVKDVLSNEGF